MFICEVVGMNYVIIYLKWWNIGIVDSFNDYYGDIAFFRSFYEYRLERIMYF